MRQAQLFIIVFLLIISFPSHSEFRSWLDSWFKRDKEQAGSSNSNISDGEISGALKQALKLGINRAISDLGRRNGFYGSQRFHIPPPENLRKITDTLKKLGMSKYVNKFERTMNRAAEAAILQAKPVFLQTMRSMSIGDAIRILKGSNTAATQYFRRKTSAELMRKMLPVTKQATENSGVSAAYKKMVVKLGFAGQFIKNNNPDLDTYITQKAIDSLFVLIAEEEKAIRLNPVKRTTQLLRKVFSHVAQ